jgi:hypothetical protein
MIAAVGADLWDRYWKRPDELAHLMKAAQLEARKICSVLRDEYEIRETVSI